MDDLVVIIITLVIAGFGILGQIKKQKQKQNPLTPSVENAPEDIWDLIKREMNPPVEEMQEEVYDDMAIEEPLDSYQAPNYNFDAKQEGNPLLREKKISDNLERSKASKIKKSFSLRDAVIYNEILNRKYT